MFGGLTSTLYSGETSREHLVVSLSNNVDWSAKMERLRQSLASQGLLAALHAATEAQDVLLTARSLSQSDSFAAKPFSAQLNELCLRDMSMDERARRLSLTRREFRQKVRGISDLDPRHYVAMVRISRAQNLLATSALSISKVGLEVGFADAAYFARVFARHTGQSPSHFRRAQRRSQENLHALLNPPQTER